METLFHYTTAAGLLGILNDSAIWATDLRFLNDAKESIYARDAVVEAIINMENPIESPDHWAHKHGKEAIDTFAGYQAGVIDELRNSEFGVFVSCFCESGDLLSQWRGYGKDHGYAVEVAKSALEDAVKKFPTYGPASGLFQVKYGMEAAASVVENAIKQVADFNLNHPGVKAHYSALAVSSMLAQVKHPGFLEEREWRLIVGLEVNPESPSHPGPTLYRATPMAIIPYIQIPFERESIASIRIGPGDNTELRAGGVRRLLKTLDVSATVTHSDVPLRS